MLNWIKGVGMRRVFLIFLTIMMILNFTMPKNVFGKDYLIESEKEIDQRMDWWRKARFGMFIHWGLYSIPAGKWGDETGHAEWIRTTAQIPLETYDQFLDDFNPVNYNPEKWVTLAKQAGMKYIVITTKHHDGFCLFDSKFTGFDVMSTPYGKDLLKPLARECREQGVKLGWYHSIMDWHHPDYLPRRAWEKDRPTSNANFDEYVKYMKNQLKELLTGYGDIGVLWFDGEWEKNWNDKRGRDLYNYVRGLQEDIIINNRVGASRSGMAGFSDKTTSAGDFGTPEQEIPATGMPGVDWETCMTMNDRWGYNKYDDNWKSTQDLIHKLIDIASKGGNFLLNVGPKADGTFPDESITRLKAIGKWMDKYGESIYKTQASPFKKFEWGRCTQKRLDNGTTNLYFQIFDWPKNNKLIIPGLVSDVNSAYSLQNQNEDLSVEKKLSEIIVELDPNQKNDYASVIVLNIDGEAQVAYAPQIMARNDVFVEKIDVELKSSIRDKDIFYTLDGTEPNLNSNLYSGPITIKNSSELKARIYINDKPISPVSSQKFSKVKPLPALDIKENELRSGVLQLEYHGDWDKIPNFTEMEAVTQKVTPKISFDNFTEKEYFGYKYEGYIKIAEDAVYKFGTMSDDGSKLYIDDRLVVDNGGLHSTQSAEGSIALAKGMHKIKVEYFDKTGGNFLKVFYQFKNNNMKELPGKFLYLKR